MRLLSLLKALQEARLTRLRSVQNGNRRFGIELLEARALLAAMDLGSSAYTQNFNALASTGSSVTVANGEFTGDMTGWYFVENEVVSATAAYAIGNGSGNAGDTYSFGLVDNTDRSLGGLRSGAVTPTIGAQFRNNHSTAITELNIAYVGEQWRLGATGRADRIDFQYSLDATSLTTGSGAWVDHNALDFSSPVTTGSTGDLDGNAAANNTSISSKISELSIPAGATFWIRWTDFDATSSDDGLSVDDFSITATTGSSGGGSGILISEVVFNPVAADDAGEEYIELRGTPNAIIPVDAYLVLLEGDSESNAGTIDHVFNIGGMQFGANGFLVLRQLGSNYPVNSSATVVTATSTGWGAPWSSRSTDIENGSVSVLVIQSATALSLDADTDVDNNGQLDGVAANWTVRDAIGNIDGGAADTAYGLFNTSGNGQGRVPGGTTFIDLNGYHPDYMARIGNSTGSSGTDWVVGELAGSMPNVTLAGNGFTRPASLEDAAINHLGAANNFGSSGDTTPPTVSSIDENASAAVVVGVPLTYTITFSEDINAATVLSADFDNAGTATVTVGAIAETSPGIFTVVVTPTSTGTLRLRIRSTAQIADIAGNRLIVPVLDNTTLNVNATTQLGPGDGAILGYRADISKGFSFVSWVDLLPGTSINFWDSGYFGGGDGSGQGAGGGNWRASEGFLTWTNNTASALAAGTVVVIGSLPSSSPTASVGSATTTSSFDFSASGDQLFMGQGSFAPAGAPPTYNGSLIYGFDFNGGVGWDAAATSTSTSVLPALLNSSAANFTVAHIDNGQYTGPRSFANVSAAKAAIQSLSNYTLEDTGSTIFIGQSFTFNAVAGLAIVQRDAATMVFENGNPGAVGVLGRTDTFTVALSLQPTSNVVLNVSSLDTGEATVSPATLTFTSANWNTPQTVTVTGAFDNVDDPDELVNVTVAVDDALSDNTFDPLLDQIVAVTVVDSPNRPTVTSISNSTTATPTLNFSDVAGETGYTVVVIDMSLSPAVEVFRDAAITANANSYMIPSAASLLAGNTYRAFLFATNGANNYSPSGGLAGSFTQFTVGGAPLTPPAKLAATSISGAANRPTINWTASASPAADFYSVYLVNLSTGLVVSPATTGPTSGLATGSFTPVSDLANGRYRVFVSATNAAGSSGFGAPFDFNVGAPIVVPTAPTGIVANGNNPPTVSWNVSPGATTYNVFLINRATNAVVANMRGLTQPSFTPPAALASGAYRISVSATNAAGTSAFSAPHDFVVGTPLAAPSVPVGLAVTGLNSLRPTVTWNAVPSATSYAVYFIHRDTNTVISSITNLTTPSFTPTSDLLAGGNYRIWVRAINTLGSSAFSSPLDFKRDNQFSV